MSLLRSICVVVWMTVVVATTAACQTASPIANICEAANRVATGVVAVRSATEDPNVEHQAWYRDLATRLVSSAEQKLDAVHDESYTSGPTYLGTRSAAQAVRTAIDLSPAPETALGVEPHLAAAESDLSVASGVVGPVCAGPSEIRPPW